MERRRASCMRDPQRSRVYAWEEAVVAPRDPTAIPYKQAQMLVDGIWLAEQLLYPPRVAPMPRQARRTWSSVKKAVGVLRRVWERRGTRYAGPREPPREGRTKP